MRSAVLLACLLCFRLGTHAQVQSAEVKVDLNNLTYPILAISARIQGDVVFEVLATEQEELTGHPLLAPAARANLTTWTLPPPANKYIVVYHFGLVETQTRYQDMKIGDKFDRFFLRLFRAPTTKVVASCYSDPSPRPRPWFTTRPDGNDLLVNVFITAQARCPIYD